jgi:hypothetical protein
MNVYCLRIKKESAGKTFPFDRVYLARNGEHTVFKQLFRYALILPVDTQLKNLLLTYVIVEGGETHEFNRNDKAPPPGPGAWRTSIELHDWVMAVPILPRFIAANMPSYITAAGAYRDPENKLKRRRRSSVSSAVASPFPALTYLQTPEQNIRPVCVACPRFILHQNGHCNLGEEICYSSLAMGMHNEFRQGAEMPDSPQNYKEIENS